MSEKKPVTAVIVGAGHRAMIYAAYSEKHPGDLKIVGVAEPDRERREAVRVKYSIPEEYCFEDSFALARHDKLADCVINGTMDHQHAETSIPLLERGYDMLLEKPFAVNEEEMNRLIAAAKKHGCKVMICHVLRYTPFYRKIKDLVRSGELGDIINIQTVENVSYHHVTTSYVRGKWGNSELCHTPMLLAKCCHDLDIMMWMMDETKPVAVSSFGSKFQFKPENAPEGAGTRCLTDCPLADTCTYSAKRIYLDHPNRWEFYVWQALENIKSPTREQREELLKTSPYGVCVYKADNDVVDHQSVLVNFENGATGTHNMVGGSATALRTIHITGTRGEVYGEFEHNYIKKLIINSAPKKEFDFTEYDLTEDEAMLSGHGGGDFNLTEDFIAYQRGETPSVSCTSIFDSAAGHETVFLAERSRLSGGAVQYFPEM